MDEHKDKGQSQEKKQYRPRKKFYRNRKPQDNYKKPEKQEIVKKHSFHKVSIVVPLYNEEESLEPLTSEIIKAVNNVSNTYELIFVDDGSVDNSLQVIRKLASSNNRIKYLSFRKNYGKSAALQVGFESATGEAVITIDADLQDDPAEIPNLLRKLEEGYDLVSGWKKTRHDPFIKKHSSKFFNRVTKVMSGIDIHDFNCGLKAYRKDVVKNINVYGELHRYIPVLADWRGFRISEIPVKHHPRRYGKTKFGLSRFFKGFFDLITVVFTTRYVKRPMHLFGLLGAISFIAGFILSAYLTVLWAMGETNISNRPLLFLGMLLIIIGVQFFGVGLLGELMVHNSPPAREYSVKEKR